MSKPYTITITESGTDSIATLTLTLKKESMNSLLSLATTHHNYQSEVPELDEDGQTVLNEDGTASMVPVSQLEHLSDVIMRFLRESAQAEAIKLANAQAQSATEAQFNSMLS